MLRKRDVEDDVVQFGGDNPFREMFLEDAKKIGAENQKVHLMLRFADLIGRYSQKRGFLVEGGNSDGACGVNGDRVVGGNRTRDLEEVRKKRGMHVGAHLQIDEEGVREIVSRESHQPS